MPTFLPLLFVLYLAFAGVVADLDAPEFAKRQAASAVLRRWHPLSGPACVLVSERTASAEARHRAEVVIADWRDFAAEMTAAGPADRMIRGWVECDEEWDDLPWLNQFKYDKFAFDPRLRLAMARYVAKLKARGLFADASFYCEPDCGRSLAFVQAHNPWEGYLGGIQTVRFVVRGLPDPERSGVPTDEVKRRWAALKATGTANESAPKPREAKGK